MVKKEKMKGLFKRLLSFVLGLTLIITIINGFQSEASITPRDLSTLSGFHLVLEKFQVKKYNEQTFKDLVVDGALVSPVPEVFVSDTARISYKFNITEQVNPGDFFVVKLPDKDIFKGYDQNNKLLMNGTEQIGTIQSNVEEGTLKVTLTKGGSGIQNGFLAAGGSFVKEKTSLKIPIGPTDAGVNIAVTPKPEADKNHFNPGSSATQPSQPTMNKYGYYEYEGNNFVYSIVINGDERAKLFKDKVSKKDRIKPRKNVYVIDELPEGTSFRSTKTPDRELIRLTMNLEVPSYENGVITEDKMSNFVAHSVPLDFWTKNGNTTVNLPSGNGIFFTLVRSDGTEDWAGFQKKIIEGTERTIGIWNHKKVVVKVGNLPLEDVKYSDFYTDGENGLKRKLLELERVGKISKEQRERMEIAYADQPLISFLFEYRTFINGDEYRDKYLNKALFFYNDGKVYERTRETPLDWLKGGATLLPYKETLTVEKKWIGTPGSNSIQVQLFTGEDGNIPVPESEGGIKTLTAPLWKDQFTNLKKDVKYTVKETPIPNYLSKVKRTKDGFIITNIEQATFQVTKEWKKYDGSPLTSIPEGSIRVGLYKKGSSVPIESVILSKTEGWTKSFQPVEVVDGNNDPIAYYVKEENTPLGFTSSFVKNDKEFILTNKQIDPSTVKTRIEVEKIWRDSDDKIVKNTTSTPIEVELIKNGTSAPVATITLTSASEWRGAFEDVAVFDGETVNKYTVREKTLFVGYEDPKVEGNREDGFTITNKQKKTAVRVEKKWLKTDGSAFSNTNLPEIEVDLFKEGEPTTPIMTKKLTMFDNWVTFFTGLPLVNELNQAIKYTVKERWVPFGFDTATANDNIPSAVLIPGGGGDSYSASFTITNSQKQHDDIVVKKLWKDRTGKALDPSKIPSGSITLRLFREGESSEVANQTVSATDNWTATFSNLPMYSDVDGNKLIKYYVKEDAVSGFSTSYDTSKNPIEVINTPEARPDISVKKIWKTPEDQEIPREDQVKLKDITVKLFDNADPSKEIDRLVLSASNRWSGRFMDLDKYNSAGNEITYKVEEVSVPGFATSYDSQTVSPGDNNVEITNTQVPRKSITVTKEWKNTDGTALTAAKPSVIFKIYKKDGLTPIQTKILASTDTSLSFTNLPKYECGTGTPLEYRLEEESLVAYDTAYQVNGAATNLIPGNVDSITVTNTLKKSEDIEVIKIWKNPKGEDISNVEHLPSIKLYLYKKGDPTTIYQTATLPNTSGEKWKAVFSGLPLFESDGVTPIEYEIAEKNASSSNLSAGNEVSGYHVAYEKTTKGWKVVNTQEKTYLVVEKVWTDSEAKPLTDVSSLPEVTVHLYDKKDRAKRLASLKLNKDNGFSGTFEKLPKYEADGSTLVEYEVQEEAISGYEVKYKTTGHTVTVTNKKQSYIPPYIPDLEGEKPKEETKEEPKEPKPDTPKEDIPTEDATVPPLPPTLENPDLFPYTPVFPVPITPTVEVPEIPNSDETSNIPNHEPIVTEQIPPVTPPSPPTIPISNDEEIPELNLDGDEVPLGDTTIQLDENGNPIKKDKENSKLDKDKDEKKVIKKKIDKILAKTGGLAVRFIPAIIALTFLISAFLLTILFGSRRTKK